MLCFKDGRRFERYSVPHRLDGQPIGRLWGFRDVTGQQQLEDQLRQAQKMDAIGKLAGGVAHDFNNLITVMKMHAELLAEDLEATDARLHDVRQIAEAANRAAGLTRQLLAFSRKQVLQPEVLAVNEVVDGMEGMLRRLIGEDIAIRTALPEISPGVLADRGQVEQVLLNLAVNARDAMVGGGVLTISTGTVRLDEAYGASHGAEVPVGEYALLTVSDTGCGIPKEIRNRIFEPFFTTKELGRGTGLGLSTVYGIVKQSNGFIWVYSEVGHGTTFKVYLPRAEASRAPVVTYVAEPCLDGTETVLLAEDEDAVRALAQRVLEKHGYRVLAARNGQEALRVAAAHGSDIDVLVSDVVMPELGGAALAERVRASIPAVAVIYMSGYTEDDIVRRAVERAQPELALVG
jgi:signal transduction histidine kinase